MARWTKVHPINPLITIWARAIRSFILVADFHSFLLKFVDHLILDRLLVNSGKMQVIYDVAHIGDHSID
jgi:hypothetical protein